MIEFYVDTRVDLKTVFPHGPPASEDPDVARDKEVRSLAFG
jgi:hypothetical protein